MAAELMGRCYRIEGRVVPGEGRGRQIGVPTANLGALQQLIPKSGVYFTRVRVDTEWYPSVTNIGIRPTFGGKAVRVESHLLCFEESLYSKRISVEICRRWRDERQFESVSELRKQISSDIQAARDYFEAVGG